MEFFSRLKTYALKKPVLLLSGFLAMGFALYGQTLYNPFIFDDLPSISENKEMRELSNLPASFLKDPFGEKLNSGTVFYRPLPMASFYLEYAAGAGSPFVFHLDNILLHCFNAFLLSLILLRFGVSPVGSFFYALIFLIHPLNSMPAAYISDRPVLLGSFFAFLFFYAFLKGDLIVSSFSFIFSVLSKENFVFLPLLPLIYAFVYEKNFFWDSLKKKLFCFFLLLSAFSYAALRFYLHEKAEIIPLSFLSGENPGVRTLTFIRALVFYVRELILPIKVAFENHFIERNFFNFYNFIFAGYLLFMSIAYYRNRTLFRHLFFFSFWFLCFLLPVSGIFIPLSATTRSQWVYFSSSAFFAFLALTVPVFPAGPWRKKIFATAGLWLVFLLVQAWGRASQWSDPVKFFSNEVRLEPSNYLAWCALGVQSFNKGDYISAENFFEESLKRSPGQSYNVALKNLEGARKMLSSKK